MPTIVRVPDYEASSRQTVFHTTDAYEALYGGAAGGGKTAALVAEAVTTALEHPGIVQYIFRRTIPELKATIMPEIYRQCGAYINAGHMTYHGQDREWRFRNGAIIRLGYCDNPADIFKYQGVEIQCLYIDEITHWPFDWYEYLKTRIRSSDPSYPLRIRAATNPGGIGHGWVKNYFIDATIAEIKYEDPDTHMTRIFIPAKVDDHPIESFRESYSRSLDAISDPSLRRALREGDWDQFSGQVFTEWRREKHVVEPFSIPDHWVKWLGYDWGYGNNSYAAALWFARDPQTLRVYIYREFYERGMVTSEQAKTIVLMSQGEILRTQLGDPAIFKSRPNLEEKETINDVMRKEGLRFLPANNDRMAGKAAWHEALSPADDGLPRFQVFSTCTNLIRTLPMLPYDINKVDDVDTDAEDHLYDAGRYGIVAARPPKIKTAKPQKKRYDPRTGRILT